jgi:hypothetical protein
MTRRNASLAAFAMPPGQRVGVRRQRHTPEGVILKQILDGLRALGVPAYRLSVGAFHMEHEGRRRFVKMGTPGLPDVMALIPGAVLFIEVKAARGKLSPAQVDFRNQCLRTHNLHVVARSLDDVVPFLKVRP